MKITTLGTCHGHADDGRFFTSTLFETNEGKFLFDAGAPVEQLLSKKDIALSEINAVFITHMHDDHVEGLTALYRVASLRHMPLRIFLPCEEDVSGFYDWIFACHSVRNEQIEIKALNANESFCEQGIRVTAYPTGHIAPFPSNAFIIEVEGKRIFLTGDLRNDFSDYPKILLEENFDLVICELTHYDPIKNLEYFKKTKTKQLIFNHVFRIRENQMRPQLCELPYKAEIAKDGDVFEL